MHREEADRDEATHAQLVVLRTRDPATGFPCPMKAVFAAVLLGSSSSCLAFFLPAATRSTASTRSPAAAAAAAAAGSRSLKARVSSSVGRRGDLGSSSSNIRCSVIGGGQRVFARRCACCALEAAGGGDGEQFGGSVDIFDALTAGDMAFVTEYVKAGGDCSVQDSIGQERERWTSCVCGSHG